jgi:hypothetical protein
VVALPDRAHVELQDVALADPSLRRDPVDDFLVQRRADRGGEPAVALERRRRAGVADRTLGNLVEL